MKKFIQASLILIVLVGATLGICFSLIYLEYLNNPKFNRLILTNTFQEPGRVFGADIDGDSDIDILGTAYDADEIAIWFQY
jgi:hypothetical protein